MSHRRRRQHLAEEERGEPGRPFADHRKKSDLGVGHVERFHTAEALHVLGVFLDQRVDDVIDGDDALDHAIVIDDRNGDEVVLARKARDFLAIGGRRNGLNFLPGYVRHLAAFRGGEQLAERHHALDAAGGVGGINRIHRLQAFRSGDASDGGERFFHRRVLRYGDELRRHQTAGRIGLVGEELLGLGALGGRNLGENFLRALFLETLEGVGAIVRRHLRDELGRLADTHRLEDFGAQLLVQVLENIGSSPDRQRREE